jgi:hypothetical protein
MSCDQDWLPLFIAEKKMKTLISIGLAAFRLTTCFTSTLNGQGDRLQLLPAEPGDLNRRAHMTTGRTVSVGVVLAAGNYSEGKRFRIACAYRHQ